MKFNIEKLTYRALMALGMTALMLFSPVVPITTGPLTNILNAQVNPVATLTQTTLSAAVGSSTAAPNSSANVGGNIITVTSATGFTAGNRLWVLSGGQSEAMDIVSVSSTNITVTRGVAGTTRHYHASSDVVFTARAALFNSQGPTSNCVSATTGSGATATFTSTTTPTPWVDIAHGDVYYCAGTQWFRTVRDGFSTGDIGSTHPITYTAAGVLYTVPGVHIINGTTLAMTLAPPTKDMDGMIMVIISQTASAQTVTYTAGFSQNTTSSDVATFGGAINDGMVIIARAGVWNVISTRNVTIA